jgi:uncharacterized phosphosugar-binding protein
VSNGEAARRYLIGIKEVLGEIRVEEGEKIRAASSAIFEALRLGHRAFNVGMNHIPPLANAYGARGNPGIFLPIEPLLNELSFKRARAGGESSFKGDVILYSDQFSSSPALEELAYQTRQLGAFTIFLGTPSRLHAVSSAIPNKTLWELCDLTIDAHTPVGDGLLTFKGLDVPACATSGITNVALFYALNLEVAERISVELTKSDSVHRRRKKSSGRSATRS